jgi:hypothetical protein
MMKKTFLFALFVCAFLLGQGRANAQETRLQVQFILRVEALGFVEPFAECSGMGSQSDILEPLDHFGFPIGKIPGQLKRYDITCRRVVTVKRSLWNWRKLIEEQNLSAALQHGEIVLTDLRGIEIARWVFSRGWPASLKISDKDFREELVLSVDDIQRVQ